MYSWREYFGLFLYFHSELLFFSLLLSFASCLIIILKFHSYSSLSTFRLWSAHNFLAISPAECHFQYLRSPFPDSLASYSPSIISIPSYILSIRKLPPCIFVPTPAPHPLPHHLTPISNQYQLIYRRLYWLPLRKRCPPRNDPQIWHYHKRKFQCHFHFHFHFHLYFHFHSNCRFIFHSLGVISIEIAFFIVIWMLINLFIASGT